MIPKKYKDAYNLGFEAGKMAAVLSINSLSSGKFKASIVDDKKINQQYFRVEFPPQKKAKK